MTSVVGPAVVGEGEFRYEVVEDWAHLPEGWTFHEVAAVGVDSKDNVYVFSRSEHPVTVFDRDGRFIRSWGEGHFGRPHGLLITPDDLLYLADDGQHTVSKCTSEGETLMTLGTPGTPSPAHSGRPFNRPTHIAVDDESGDLFVSDGYANSSVHRYSSDGRLVRSWGRPGSDPGEFNIPHNVAMGPDGRLFVADRENHRLQIFDRDGRYLDQWVNLHRPCALFFDRRRSHLYVSEIGPGLPINKSVTNIGPRVGVYELDGRRLARIGDVQPGEGAHQFIAPHGLAVDSRGDLYVAEVSWSGMGKFLDPPREMRCFRKLVRKH